MRAVQLHMDFHPVRIHQIVWSGMRHSTPKFGGDRYPPGRQVVISLERLDRLTAPCGTSPLLAENVSTRPRACLQSSLIMVPLRAQASYVLLHTKSLLLLRSDHRPYR